MENISRKQFVIGSGLSMLAGMMGMPNANAAQPRQPCLIQACLILKIVVAVTVSIGHRHNSFCAGLWAGTAGDLGLGLPLLVGARGEEACTVHVAERLDLRKHGSHRALEANMSLKHQRQILLFAQ